MFNGTGFSLGFTLADVQAQLSGLLGNTVIVALISGALALIVAPKILLFINALADGMGGVDGDISQNDRDLYTVQGRLYNKGIHPGYPSDNSRSIERSIQRHGDRQNNRAQNEMYGARSRRRERARGLAIQDASWEAHQQRKRDNNFG